MFRRTIIIIPVGVFALLVRSIHSQEVPKLTENFSFNLSPYRETDLGRTIEMIKVRDDAQRALELRTINDGLFSRAIDLLRFVPLNLSSAGSSIADDFFTPSYLRPEYSRRLPEALLFDTN